MTDDALPCPFCGGRDISDGEVLTKTPNGQFLTQSMCRKCGALGPEMNVVGMDYGDKAAISGWNTRTG